MAALGHLAVAIAVTAPLAWRAGRLPLGHEPVATVPQFNLWTLRWTASRIPHGFAGWWDAPIFWPHHGAFAFSEPQPLTGIAFALVRPLVGDVHGYAVVLIAALALNGIAGAALARRLGATPMVAFGAGVLAQTLPFAFAQLGVLQLLALWPMLAALSCALAWLDDPRPRHAVLLGLALAAEVWTCGYYAVLFALCLLVSAPFAVDGRWRADWQVRVAGASVALGVAGLLSAPIVVGQQQQLGDRRWLDATILAGSARWQDWAPGGRLWPGLPLVALAVAGAAVSRRDRSTRVLAAVAGAAFVASFGARLSIVGIHPWVVLTDHLTAVARLRSPYRAAALVQLALVALAVPALRWLWAHRSLVVRTAAPALVLVSVLVSGPGSGRLVAPPPEPGAWATYLGAHPNGAVVFLPFASGPRVADFEPTTGRMLQALDTGHPMLNGYSGFFPPDHALVAAALRGWPDDRSDAVLADARVAYVVITDEAFGSIDRRVARERGWKVLVHDADGWLLQAPARFLSGGT